MYKNRLQNMSLVCITMIIMFVENVVMLVQSSISIRLNGCFLSYTSLIKCLDVHTLYYRDHVSHQELLTVLLNCNILPVFMFNSCLNLGFNIVNIDYYHY